MRTLRSPLHSRSFNLTSLPESFLADRGLESSCSMERRLASTREKSRETAEFHATQLPRLRRLAGRLFGQQVDGLRDSLAIVRSLGGSGALKVGADFLKRQFPQSTVYVPDPSWENHVAIFDGTGLKVRRYRYYDHSSNGLDLDGLLADAGKAWPGDVVLLRPCCHNPREVDPDSKQ
jgi:aspartate/tyrosine/aromatic aminotransferase